ncbi:MAG: hypothetical protein KF709_03445 [Gemmatimonadaceae bacterium]|nr:hypothetical protein [Gemmatimonadaceae bacterium]
MSGSAALETSPGALLCPDVALEPTEGDVAIKFGSTADLASPECALLTGSIVYGALAFQPPLVPTVRVPASGNPLLAEYYLVRAGELEILESTPSKLFGRFDFEAATTDGTTIKAIRVRGSFWVVP